MAKKTFTVPEQQEALERLSEELLSAVDDTRQACRDYYEDLAHTAAGCLKRTSANLKRALQETREAEDE